MQLRFACGTILASLAAGVLVKEHVPGHHIAAFHSFIDQHGRHYKKGTHEYFKRLTLFSERLQKAEVINSRPGHLWIAGVGPLSDLTPEELSQKKGWAGFASRKSPKALRTQMSLLQSESDLPEECNKWANLTMLQAKDQGGCGSCWAVTSATVLEAHREIYLGKQEQLSAQQLVNCVENPRNCGGTGGCAGATVELAMAYVVQNGLASEAQVPYQGADHECQTGAVAALQLAGSDDLAASGVRKAKASSVGLQSLGIHGWEKLPENKYLPLMRAVVQHGPVAVSVSADSWDLYLKGIFDYCSKDVIIDHAVTLTGYGKDVELGKKYWRILNSWGKNFGEDGTIRLLRTDQEDCLDMQRVTEGARGPCPWKESWCGIDSQPELGTGCDGGPTQVTVCGMCWAERLRVGAAFSTIPRHQSSTMRRTFAASQWHAPEECEKAATVCRSYGTSRSRASKVSDAVPSQAFSMWPLLLGGLGLGALAARQGLRAVRASGVKVNFNMPAFGGFGAFSSGMQGFEAPMTRAEARQILNLSSMAPSKDAVREAHRRLLIANHPDKGGSTYIASKINEAKEVMLGKKAT
ncbi:CTSS [Symbiodinium necroappetens]|uniref:CTSS protein n=1 Tax=Symbiodinium necroappetens TaxID=1628268 RepID=A0A813C2A0_9DINO|nr:CTSS [Symbiodinium necroappetens]